MTTSRARVLVPEYDRSHTRCMKTAVSIPDAIFDEADRAAKRLGLSRSELYARAIATYVARLRADHVTEALDRVYATQPAEPDPILAKLQRRTVAREKW